MSYNIEKTLEALEERGRYILYLDTCVIGYLGNHTWKTFEDDRAYEEYKQEHGINLQKVEARG